MYLELTHILLIVNLYVDNALKACRLRFGTDQAGQGNSLFDVLLTAKVLFLVSDYYYTNGMHSRLWEIST